MFWLDDYVICNFIVAQNKLLCNILVTSKKVTLKIIPSIIDPKITFIHIFAKHCHSFIVLFMRKELYRFLHIMKNNAIISASYPFVQRMRLHQWAWQRHGHILLQYRELYTSRFILGLQITVLLCRIREKFFSS